MFKKAIKIMLLINFKRNENFSYAVYFITLKIIVEQFTI